MINNPMQILQAFMQFKNSLHGDPKQIVQNLMSSGQISQEQYRQLELMAKQLQGLLK